MKLTETLMQKHLAASTSHSAVNVDVVMSPRGLKFWRVPSHAVPLVSLEFAMRGGSAQDPAEKAGLGALMSALLDEGAGDLDSQAFHRALTIAVVVPLRPRPLEQAHALHKNLVAPKLLRLAVNTPRFDRSRSKRARAERAPAPRRQRSATVASRTWKAKSFPDHPTASRPRGQTLARTVCRCEARDCARSTVDRGSRDRRRRPRARR